MDRSRFASYVEIVANLAVIAGLLTFGIQYFAAKRDSAIRQSLEYQMLWEESGRSGDYDTIRDKLEDNIIRSAALRSAMQDASENAALAKAIAEKTLEFRHSDGELLRRKLDRILDFFESIRTCTDAGICDVHTACIYFGDLAQSLWENFEIQIEERRILYPGYGSSAERFALDDCEAGPGR